jgi:PAS domain S-box-containing protein
MFQALFETAPDAMVVVDRSGRIVLTNPQAERLFGHSATAMAGQPIEMLMPASLRGAHVRHRDHYMEAPRVRPMGAGQELIGLRADGREFPIEIALSPIEDAGKHYYVASIRDISETQRARQALVRARYDAALAQIGQTALESSHGLLLERLPGLTAEALILDVVAIALLDPAGGGLQLRTTTGDDSALLDALRWSQEQGGLLQRPFADARAVAIADFAAEPGDPTAAALGRAGFVSGAMVPLFDLGRPMGALLALSRQPHEFDRDALHFLQSAANVLAAAVQRNRTQEQLAHVQRLDAIGKLTGGIAHDFNNLLTVISGNLQLLEADLADSDAMHAVEGGLRAVARGAELTRKLLAFARRQRLEPQALDVQLLLDDLSSMLKPTLGAAIEIASDCPPGLPRVFADPGQLESALVNLALNARDAMPRGGRLRIDVRSEQVERGNADLPPGRYVVFAIVDTGLGMGPDVLSRAFEPFYTTKSSGKGSGLGLSIVYGFVKQSGGHLTVDSKLGYGTRIELFLPVADDGSAPPTVAGPGTTTGGNETVLVVEDEPEVRGIAEAFLRSLGYGVLSAGSADEALAVFDRHPEISLLFSDVVLGAGLNGGELGVEARRRRPGLPVLLTSGYERPTGDDLEIDSPTRQFELLRKPYRREQLAEAVRRQLDQASAARKRPPPP